jgi:hypothetical protein
MLIFNISSHALTVVADFSFFVNLIQPQCCRFHYNFKECPVTSCDSDGVISLWRGPGDGNIVSYNPHLLCAAQCHIHTTIVSGPRAIPYVCKYLGKGDTYARAAIVEAKAQRRASQDPNAPPIDVAGVYMKRRMVTFSEAIVRLLEGELIQRSPPVVTVYVMIPRLHMLCRVLFPSSLHASIPSHTCLSPLLPCSSLPL